MTKNTGSRKAIKKSIFIDLLLKWAVTNLRSFPWRKEKDPYRILVAEIMLQRTKSEQVLPVYERFISRFPDIDSLFRANPSDIRKFTNGLGLFWRSELIIKMANKVINDFNGRIPEEQTKLLSIPGVGDYIADMIMVLAFHGKRTVIDSNVVRLVTRFFGIKPEGEMRRKKNFINFCQELTEGMSVDQIRNFNLTLIDFPAIICKPEPLCHVCPLSLQCKFFKNAGRTETR